MSLATVLAIQEAKLSVKTGGELNGSFAIGMIAASIVVPLLHKKEISKIAVIFSLFVLNISLLTTTITDEALTFVACWLVAGASSGVLSVFGALTIATSNKVNLGFKLRLSIVLIAAACVSLIVFFINASYCKFIFTLCLTINLIGILGFATHHPEHKTPSKPIEAVGKNELDGLVVVFLYFLGNTGFMAYSLYRARENGVILANLPMMHFSAQFLSGCVLLALTIKSNVRIPNFILGIGACFGIIVMASTKNWPIFSAGMLLWQISASNQSVQLQGAIVKKNPRFTGLWISSAVFLGGAAGGLLHGRLLSNSMGDLFLYLACASVFLPAFWFFIERESTFNK